jgi:ferredoxin-NADP reductase
MDHYRLTVRQQQGIGSNWLHRAQTGASVRLRSPTGEFVLDTGSVRPMVLVAAGIGITPLLAMLQAHLTRGPKAPPAHLIYGARTPAHVAFRQELDAIVAAHPEVRVHYVYSQSDAGGRPAGRITSELITKLLSGLHVFFGERRIALPWYESDIYLCGPGDFCTQLKQELIDRGANPLHIFLELFVGATVEPTELEQAEVTFERSGLTATWSAAEDLTLLELAEQAGIKIENDCRAGTCLTCRTRVVDGQMTADLSDGSGLMCIGRPKTPQLRLDC